MLKWLKRKETPYIFYAIGALFYACAPMFYMVQKSAYMNFFISGMICFGIGLEIIFYQWILKKKAS